MPRSSVGPYGEPCAATQTRSGSVGCTTMREMERVASSPRWVHVRPASVERYTPSPWLVVTPRGACSPMPT